VPTPDPAHPHPARTLDAPVDPFVASVRLFLPRHEAGGNARHTVFSDYVRRERERGAPPETVLAPLKDTFKREAAELGWESREVGALVTQVVRWAIDAYYRTYHRAD
jgi:hypothetical protein